MRIRRSFFGFLLLLSAAVGAALFMQACKKRRNALDQPYMTPFRKAGEDFFVMAFLSSIEGYIEPCGCTSNPLGGLSRLVTVFNDIKTVAKDRMALIDAGNLLLEFAKPNEADRCQDEARIDLLLSTLSLLGLRNNFAGPLDLARGEFFHQAALKKHGLGELLPARAANGLSSPLTIWHGPAYDIAYFGISPKSGGSRETLRAAVLGAIAEAKRSTRIKAVIAISHLAREETRTLFLGMMGIDIVIQGLVASHEIPAPERLLEKGPLLIEAGRQGQYFTSLIFYNLKNRGERSLSIDDRLSLLKAREELLTARIASLSEQAEGADKARQEFLIDRMTLAKKELATLTSAEILPPEEPSVLFYTIPLTKKIDPNPSVSHSMQDLAKSIPLLVKKCEEDVECPKASKGQAVYVGANACKTCHQEAFDVWQKAIYTKTGLDEKGQEIRRSVGHSQAWKTLIDAGREADRSCIGCHSIGFMKAGGYCKTSDVEPYRDVQCESCHGAGSLHAASGDKSLITRNMGEDGCRSCHHVPHIERPESFVYEERLSKILGKGHGEKLLKELRHRPKS